MSQELDTPDWEGLYRRAYATYTAVYRDLGRAEALLIKVHESLKDSPALMDEIHSFLNRGW